MRRRVAIAFAAIALSASGVVAREPGDPIRLDWLEGDVAGFTPIYSPSGGAPIGAIEYHQRRRGDVLETVRVAHFSDGSSDEDQAVARVGKTLDALRGRSVIRDTHGRPTVDLQIDVTGGRVSGFYQDGESRHDVDDRVTMSPGTYWGPLVFLVLKNFASNVEDGRVRFRTVVPTPSPRLLTLELARDGSRTITRPGGPRELEHYVMRPHFGWLVDPIVSRLVPTTEFFVDPGAPPALGRYEGPRNFAGQEIRLE